MPEWLTSKTKCALFGGLAGLGFAFTENLWYYLGYLALEEGIPPGLILGRAILSLPSHAIDSAIVGMGLLYIAAMSKGGYKKALGFLSVAIILHGIWNALPHVLEWYILMLIMEMSVFGLIYHKTGEYPVPFEQIGLLMLPGREILIARDVRTFSRKDFVKDLPPERVQYISKNHFRIMRRGNKFYVEDPNSENGTILNGEDIKGEGEKELKPGSKITLPRDIELTFTTYDKWVHWRWGKPW